MSVFPYCIKNKGSSNSVVAVVNALIRAQGYHYSEAFVSVIIDKHSNHMSISISKSSIDVKALQEVFKYILPVGMSWDIQYNVNDTEATMEVALSNGVVCSTTDTFGVSVIRSSTREDTLTNKKSGDVTLDGEADANSLVGAYDIMRVVGENDKPTQTTSM